MGVIERWHEMVRGRDFEALPDLLAEDAVFESPVVHTPQAGRALTLAYLTSAMRLLNNDTFRYVGEWRAERSAVNWPANSLQRSGR